MIARTHLLEPILASYRESGGINHLDRTNLPSKKSIDLLCSDLLHLLFPGFFSEEAVSSKELPDAAQEIIDQIANQLEESIAVSLRIREQSIPSLGELKPEAVAITERLFAGIPAVRALLKTYVEAAFAAACLPFDCCDRSVTSDIWGGAVMPPGAGAAGVGDGLDVVAP